MAEKLGGYIVYRARFADRMPKPSRTYAAGRVCAHDGCRTVLSIYNSEPECARHAFTVLVGGPGVGRRARVA